MKRVWNEVGLGEAPGGWTILLDGRPMRLPGQGVLVLPRRALAEAVAAEWREAGTEAGGEVTAGQLALTRLAATAQERIAPNKLATVAAIARYGESDLLCYRAERPAALVARQAELWQPWLDWIDRMHGVRLSVVSGIVHAAQPPGAIAAVSRALASLDPYVLSALGVAVPALDSVVLGLALAAGELSGSAAGDLAELDRMFQAETWGLDEIAAHRSATLYRELRDCEQLIHLASATC